MTEYRIHILEGLQRFLLSGLLLISISGRAQPPETAKAMAEVVQIAKAISMVQPRLEEPKYIEYALGIYRASKKYGIEPDLIIAIAQQESSFKEKLREGKAGELGITQVLKRWVHNSKFRREFPTATHKTLLKPAESFLYTGWILAELKRREKHGTLPFWSFYNSRKFKNRIKYYVRVNKHMTRMARNLARLEQAPKPTMLYPRLADAPVPPMPKQNASKRGPQDLLIRSASLGG